MTNGSIISPDTPTFSERLFASKCRFCGPGMGTLAMAVPIRGSESVNVRPPHLRQRFAIVPVMCPHCGGHSAAFREETYS